MRRSGLGSPIAIPNELRILLSDQAGFDLCAAADWYQEHAGGGFQFTARVRKSLELTAAMLELHALVYEDVRRGRVRGEPYSFYYRIVEDRVEVLAILHESRSDDAWKSRA